MRQKVGELIAEDCGTAWFKDNHGGSGCELRREGMEHAKQVLLCLIEHAEVIHGAAAAEMFGGQFHLKAC